MNLEQLTIPMWCDHWARWSMTHAELVQGFRGVSMIADKWSFQQTGPAKLTPLGEHPITARGKQTRSQPQQDIPDDTLGEILDAGIAQMGVYRPDLQIVVGSEYLGGFPELYVENWRPGDEAKRKFVRLQAAWKQGQGYEMNYLRRRNDETTDMWRERLARKLGVSRAQFYTLLSQAHVYLLCWRDTELQRLVAEAEKKSA